MGTQNETAPDGTPERPQVSAFHARLNTDADSTGQDKHQVSIEDLDKLIDLSVEWERSIAKRAVMARRQTVNLILLRDNLTELSKSIWRGSL